MKLHCLLISLALCANAVSAETIHKIERARIAGPFAMPEPIKVDTTNKAKKTFELDTYLNSNKPNASLLFGEDNQRLIESGSALPVVDGQPCLNYLTFGINCDQFTKGTLSVEGIKNYKVYVDNAEASSTLSLEPNLHQVVIACLTKKDVKDSFRVSFKATVGTPVIQTTGERLYTLHDITDGLKYSGVSLSPSGKYAIVYYSHTYSNGNADRSAQLVEVKTNRVLIPRLDGTYYKWTKTDDALFYMKKEGQTNTLVSMSVPSYEEKVVARGIPDLTDYHVSPNLKYLIYRTDDEDKSGNQDLKLFNMPDDRLHDSRTHYFLNLYDLTTGVSRPLTFGQTSTHFGDLSDDGKYLLFTTPKTELHRFPFNRTSVYRYALESNQVDTLFTDTVGIKQCLFSPNGKQLLIMTDAEAFDGVGKQLPKDVVSNIYDSQLFLYDLDTKKVKPLTKDFDPSVNSAVWSRHDGQIYFSACNASKTSLYALNPTTGRIKSYSLPVSYIYNFSISSQSDVLAYYGEGPTYARKMFTSKLSNFKGECQPLGNIEYEKMFSDVVFPTFSHWSFKSSRGDSISGFYYLPPHFDAQKKYPMIVYYYGGCTPTPERIEMNYPFAVWASQGYVVYVVQPSGAIGFGQEFASRHVNTWGKGSAEDILEGTETFCAQHPYINKERVACIGASYGGFMTEYLMTRTSFFRTSVAHAGISDITGYWGAGNWGYTYSEIASAKSFPWNNPDLYVNQSPLYHADKIQTPMLLIQGSVDSNVPANQAWQLYTALKILNKPVEFIQVKGENHVISDYKKQKEWQTAICAWFARWLKDQPEWWNELYPQ